MTDPKQLNIASSEFVKVAGQQQQPTGVSVAVASAEDAKIEPSNSDVNDLYAAVDLGSNSFHLVICRYEHGEFTVLDRQREVVRLAEGLNAENILSPEVAERALSCLRRFGQLLRAIPPNQIRVVGTNALRRLHNKAKFLNAGEIALGHSIEIIAGREEARLIYLGVSKWSVADERARLVIDIGGGSTELIVGKGDEALCRESIEVGCVVQTQEFFADGVLSQENFESAILAAKLAIQPEVKQFRSYGWTQVLGCSGTMKSLAEAAFANDWAKDGINRTTLGYLLDYALSVGHADKLELPGLSRDRKPVFAGGLSIILAIFELFEIEQMAVSDIALREGVLYDLVGRSTEQDIRDVTIAAMLSRWAVQVEHGDRVRGTALELYRQVAVSWDIQDKFLSETLGWAAQLHELGLLVSHDGYHKHGAYFVANADMAGFARRDQILLASMIEGHRGKFPVDSFEQLPSSLVTPAKRIAAILRIAVLLQRGRSAEVPTVKRFSVDGQQLTLEFDTGILKRNPLTVADLNREQNCLKAIGLKLTYS